MLYSVLKVIVRLAAKIFCRKIIINNRDVLKERGPMILACNHPNSFLDAVIMDILFEQPIWSLTRGDAFLGKTVNRILFKLKMLPVYRPTEGVENLSENYKTFDTCIEIFQNNGLVQIFSEGKCINEWHLRPLKKGTARLALSCWEKNVPVKVLPVAINYSSFRKFGKNIFIHAGKPLTCDDIDMKQTDGLRNQQFNNLLRQELEKGVFEINHTDLVKKKRLLEVNFPRWKKFVLFIPAVVGFIIHAPLYLPAKFLVLRKTSDNDHYDSILIAVLFLTYPIYILLMVGIAFLLLKSRLVLLLLFLFPFTAWSYVQLKTQID